MDDIQCDLCLGLGYVDSTHPRNPQKYRCDRCGGLGLLDWLAQVTGRRVLSRDEEQQVAKKFSKVAREKKIVIMIKLQKLK
ncbi:hypothetical protein KAR91_13070 [Candidatus Pacearchaeota archaeon]|nr:hypothetical protein [Candidatus Pacearchaeota archaeon]